MQPERKDAVVSILEILFTRYCQSVKVVTLLRSPSGSLGFSVVGGSDCVQGCLPIYIKSVVTETPAAKDGRLR